MMVNAMMDFGAMVPKTALAGPAFWERRLTVTTVSAALLIHAMKKRTRAIPCPMMPRAMT